LKVGCPAASRAESTENHFSGFSGIPFQLERERNATLIAFLIGSHHACVFGGYSASSCNGKQRYQHLKITKEFVDIPIKNGFRDGREAKSDELICALDVINRCRSSYSSGFSQIYQEWGGDRVEMASHAGFGRMLARRKYEIAFQSLSFSRGKETPLIRVVDRSFSD